ncbi:MAG: zinc-ribbon domain-containing protein [Clostridiales bacterium]|nr:zinc-ribbon domain-containing protein [Clostridiales bacterium]
MYCSRCGSINQDSSKFCQKCGTPVTPVVQTPPVQTPYIPPQSNAFAPPAAPYPPNTGFRPAAGMPYHPKQKNPVLVAAGVLVSLAVVIVVVLLLATMNPTKVGNVDVSGGPSSGIALGSNSPDVSPAQLPKDGMRENYTQLLGGGADEVTVMIYICGADLESDGACGTLDINEMLAADLGDNVNVVLETGGCTYWSTPGIIDGEVQRWALIDGELVELERLGKTPMLDAGELSDFIRFAEEKFPANRYQLIFWDHGGGSLYGFGYDEMYPDTVMFLTDIADALEKSGVKFDIIGFDACLMGTIETAYMLEPYADYLIGSEETEPAYGWDYTPWLNVLGGNPSINTVELGKVIVDSFLEHNATDGAQDSPDNTLSVVELREIPGVYEELCDYMENATEALANKEFKMISSAVARSRSFAEGDYDLIDIVDFAVKADLEGLEDLKESIQSAVKYSDSTARTGVYGLSMYFPYTYLEVYGYAKNIFAEFGYGGPIYVFYDSFVNIVAGGQTYSNTRSLMETVTQQENTQTEPATDYSSFAWYDDSEAQSYDYDTIDYSALEIMQDEEGIWYLPMTEDDWSLITEVQMQILFDDGEGYIDLGSDQYWETDENGNLLLNYGADNTWYAIDGQIVCYYALDTIYTETDTIFLGYVPAVLNGTTDIDIIVERDGEYGEDYIAGYRFVESNSTIGGEGTLGKGYKQFKPGDKIDFVCDFYTYEGDFDDSYLIGETVTIGLTPPTVTYEDVGENNVLQCYMLVDVYQNYSWTEYVEFSVVS